MVLNGTKEEFESIQEDFNEQLEKILRECPMSEAFSIIFVLATKALTAIFMLDDDIFVEDTLIFKKKESEDAA